MTYQYEDCRKVSSDNGIPLSTFTAEYKRLCPGRNSYRKVNQINARQILENVFKKKELTLADNDEVYVVIYKTGKIFSVGTMPLKDINDPAIMKGYIHRGLTIKQVSAREAHKIESRLYGSYRLSTKIYYQPSQRELARAEREQDSDF